MTALVNYQIANLNAFSVCNLRAGARPAQEGFDSIFQFAWTKRLGQIVVGPGFEPGNLIVERVVRSQEQRRRLHSAIPKPLQQFQASQTRHRNVENKTIKLAGQRRLESL